MNEVICPNCKKAFKIDEAGFADILKQVRGSEFEKEIHERLEMAEKDKLSAVRLAEEKAKNQLQADLSKKDSELSELRSQNEMLVTKVTSEKDVEITKLRQKLETTENEKEVAVKLAEETTKNDLQTEAAKKDALIAELTSSKQSLVAELQAKQENELTGLKARKDAEIASLQAKLESAELEKTSAIQIAQEKAKNELQADVAKSDALLAELKSEKDTEIANLQAKIESAETEKKLALSEAVNKLEKERDGLASELRNNNTEKQLLESTMKDKYETQIKDRDDSIERLKDMKAKLSIKLIGENLEQHCQNEFNNVRSSMFPFAYFEKDNETVEHTKGDYIYRDYESKNGVEIISIMFEMKDEQDTSINKKTVESHLKKLDEDRRKKRCEYGILVTLLEADNELYNRGIVDVSYKYDKMFVVRPQFFLPLISLLKNASVKSAEDRRQLVAAKNSNIDIENFVDNMENWKGGWLKVMKNAGSKHVEGIEQINKAIKDLEKARDALMMSDKHLLTAENKVDDLTVKRLTKNAPSVAERFSELENK